ncbi:MAG: TetR/AcrR family transcriptional regulator [Demequinaceae bacterium]|nr:TetR/AcrR family transcriptional regulator [Demequinaceae bacterium]
MFNDPDQTARANIRTSALELFAAKGPDAVTIREIAAAAGVSPGLVLHHYGSKQGLRNAVDEYVAALFEVLTKGSMADMAAPGADTPGVASGFAELLIGHLPPHSPIPAYLRRLLLADDPAGRQIFRTWYNLTLALTKQGIASGAMRPSADPEVRAAFLMINDLATMLLHKNLAAVVGVDPLTPDGIARWAADAIDAYSTGVFRLENE